MLINKTIRGLKPSLDLDPHVTMRIGLNKVKGTIVDGGSAINVILEEMWEKMGKPRVELAHYTLTITNQTQVKSLGTI